jgi:short-subunit dehydrogenase
MEVKSFGIHITNVAPGDFATNIASGRYHAPVIKGSAYEVSYGESLRTMDEHVDGGSNPNEMAEAVYKIIQTKEPKVHYKVGFYAAIFDCIETDSTDKIYEKC